MDSVGAKFFHSRGFLSAKIAVLRDQANIEDVFVILHFDGPPAHFACLHVKKSSSIYYDSLPNNNNRPFNEYPELRELGEIKIHRTDTISRTRGMWMYGGVTLLAIIS